MIRVLHVTPGLENGGAEVMLSKLVTRMDATRFQSIVVSLTDEGPILGGVIRRNSVKLITLGFSRGVANPMIASRLARVISDERPDIIHTWMYHSNVIGSAARLLSGRRPLVWSLHKAKFNLSDFKPITQRIIQLNRMLSGICPTKIVCISAAACEAHVAIGYPRRKMHIIDNGIDTSEFKPNQEARLARRREYGLSADTPLIGLVARYTKEKDHPTFFTAAQILNRRRPDVHFLLCGSGVTRENKELAALVDEAGVSDVTHLMGLTGDPAGVTSALDVATCSSAAGESFCLALGEAMACGVPCVTTNLDGPAALIDGHGLVIPVGDPTALAAAWEAMLNLSAAERATMSSSARNRIETRYSLTSTVREYESLYAGLLSGY